MRKTFIKIIAPDGTEHQVSNIEFSTGFDVNVDTHGVKIANTYYNGGLDYKYAKNIYDISTATWQSNVINDKWKNAIQFAVYNGSTGTNIDTLLPINTIVPMSRNLMLQNMDDVFVIDANGVIYDWHYTDDTYFGELNLGINVDIPVGTSKNFYVIFGNDDVTSAFKTTGNVTYFSVDDITTNSKLEIYPVSDCSKKLEWRSVYGKLYVDTSELNLNDIVIVEKETLNAYKENTELSLAAATPGTAVQKCSPELIQTANVSVVELKNDIYGWEYYWKFTITPTSQISGPVCIGIDIRDYIQSGMMAADCRDVQLAVIDENDNVVNILPIYIEPDTIGTEETKIWTTLTTDEIVTCMLMFGNPDANLNVKNSSIFTFVDDFEPAYITPNYTIEEIDDGVYKVVITNTTDSDIVDGIVKLENMAVSTSDSFVIEAVYSPTNTVSNIPYTIRDGKIWIKLDMVTDAPVNVYISKRHNVLEPNDTFDIFTRDINVVTDGLDARYKIDGKYPYIAYGGLTSEPGKIGSSLRFNGSAYAEFDFINKNSHTFTFWFKTDNLDNSKPFMSCGSANNILNAMIYGNKLHVQLWDGANQAYLQSCYLQTDTWYFATLNYTKGQAIEIFLNNAPYGTTFDTTNVTLGSTIKLGGRYDSETLFLQGNICDFRAFDGILSSTYRTQIYNEGKGLLDDIQAETCQIRVSGAEFRDTIDTTTPQAYNVTFAADKYNRPNRAWKFNGSTSKVNTNFTLGATSTIMFDVYIDETNDDNIILGNSETSFISAGSYFKVAHNGLYYSTDMQLQPGTWYTVAIVDDGLGSLKCYIEDLEQVHSAFTETWTNSGTLSGMQINNLGYYLPDAANSSLNGRLANIYIFNRALNATEVHAITSDTKNTDGVVDVEVIHLVDYQQLVVTCDSTVPGLQINTGISATSDMGVSITEPVSIVPVLTYVIDSGTLYVEDTLESYENKDYYVLPVYGYAPGTLGTICTGTNATPTEIDKVYTKITIENNGDVKDGWINLGTVPYDCESLQITGSEPEEIRAFSLYGTDLGLKVSIPAGTSKSLKFDFNTIDYKCQNTVVRTAKPYWITPDLQTVWTITDGNEIINVNVTNGNGPDGVSVFEDFDDSFTDLNKYVNDGATLNVSDNILNVTGNAFYNVYSNTSFNAENIIFESNAKFGHSDVEYGMYLGFLEPNNTEYVLFSHLDTSNKLYSKNDGVFSTTAVTMSTEDDFHTYKIEISTNAAKYYQDDILLGTRTENIPTPTDSLFMGLRVYENTNMDVDYWFIRKYLETPPTVTKIGNVFTVDECSTENYQIALDVSDLGLASAVDSLLIESITSVIPEGVELTPTIINYGDGTFKVIITNNTDSDIDGNVYIDSSVFGVVTENTSIKITDM